MKPTLNILDAGKIDVSCQSDMNWLGQKLGYEVNGKEGHLLLKNLKYDVENPIERERVFLALAAMLGTPHGHNAFGKIIWDIKPQPMISGVPTFSEHQDEAPPHNDSAYSEKMEDFFGLAVVNPARDGGGRSRLVQNRMLIEELSRTAAGRSMLNTLREDFPFAVPSVFQWKGIKNQEVVVAPVLEGFDSTRFRLDLILKGFQFRKDLWTPAKEAAVHSYNNLANQNRFFCEFYMEKGDMLFSDNRRLLHARTRFSDPSRHLLRVRMVI